MAHMKAFLLFCTVCISQVHAALETEAILEDVAGSADQPAGPWYGQTSETFTDNSVIFHLADLTTTFRMQNGQEAHLEAFATMDNDGFYNRHQNQVNPDYEDTSSEQGGNRASRFHWVSVGVPTLLWSTTTLPNGQVSRSILEAGSDEFVAQIQMLTERQRVVLARKASQKYRIRVSADQISHLILELFACQLNVTDEDGRRYSFVGNVRDFRNFPLLLHFPVEQGTTRWDVLRARHNDTSMHFHCFLQQPSGRTLKTNTLTITQSDIKNSKLLPRLFGQRDSVYVTKEQMEQFATDLVTSMRVVEEYNVRTTDEFGEEFVRELIKNHVVSEFGNKPFAEAIEQLAAYRLFEGRRTANSLNSTLAFLNDFLAVDRNSSVLTVNPKLRCFNQSRFQINLTTCELQPLAYLGIQDTATLVSQLRNGWLHARLPIEDQITELSEHPSSNIGWEFQDGKVVPLWLNVTLVTRSSLTKPRTFARIRRQYHDAWYSRTIALYVRRAIAIETDGEVAEQNGDEPKTIDLRDLFNEMRDSIVRQVAAQISRFDSARLVRIASEDIENIAQDVHSRLHRNVYLPIEKRLNTMQETLNATLANPAIVSTGDQCVSGNNIAIRQLSDKIDGLISAQRLNNSASLAQEIRRLALSVDEIVKEMRSLRGQLARNDRTSVNVSLGVVNDRREPVGAVVGRLGSGKPDRLTVQQESLAGTEVLTVGTLQFKKHPNLCLRGYNARVLIQTSLQECGTQCWSDPQCASFNFYSASNECELKQTLSLDAFQSKAKPYEGCSFYYAACSTTSEGRMSSANGTYVYIHANNPKSYNDSLNFCANQRHHLVEPRNSARQKLLEASMRRIALRGAVSNYFWINAERLAGAARNLYSWNSDKSDIALYSWAPGQPDNTNSGDCLLLELGKGVTGGWYKENCQFNPSIPSRRKFGVICQCNDYGVVGRS